MFFPKKHSCRNNTTYSAILQQISQGHGIPSLPGDSGRTQQNLVTTNCTRDQRGQRATKTHELEVSFPFLTARFKLLYILGPQTFQSAIQEALSGKRYTEHKKLDCTKRESNFSQEADKAHYSSALISWLER